MALVVAGSSPVTHPIHIFIKFLPVLYAPVAQLDRASDFESAGRGFESLRACQMISKACSYFTAGLFSYVAKTGILDYTSKIVDTFLRGLLLMN